jgi:hypothetical protein
VPKLDRVYYGSTMIYEPPSWPKVVELSGASRVTITGDTTGPTAHVKGAWSELIASTDAAARWLVVDVQTGSNASDSAALLDIGTGAAGSETVRIADMGAGQIAAVVASAGAIKYLFPMSIPSGTRIAARIQFGTLNGAVARTGNMSAGVYTDDRLAALPTTLDTMGADTANSRGTTLTNANTYYELTSSTTQDYQALVATVTAAGATNRSNTSMKFTVGKGASGAEVELFSFEYRETNTESMFPAEAQIPALYTGHIPAGTRLSVKVGTGGNGTFRDVILHGVPYA